jgi:hypothetical protein
MTSFRQFQANRRNAQKSTGPRSEQGKQRSSQNAVRHGLTAETVIEPVEDAEDYKAFEAAVTADYDSETAVERELVLRLTSLLWRLRRATSIETGLLELDGEPLLDRRQVLPAEAESKNPLGMSLVRVREPAGNVPEKEKRNAYGREGLFVDNDFGTETAGNSAVRIPDNLLVARCFLRLGQIDNGVFERLGRYEMALWRQVRQMIFTLDGMRGRLNIRPRRQHPWWKDQDLTVDRERRD